VKNLNIKEIKSIEAMLVRHKVLWPNKSIEFCQVPGDESAWHFGAFIGELLVCVASVYPSDTSARLRKFATLQEYQGQGIGTIVLSHILEGLGDKGITTFWCDARESALDFYRRFGLKTEGNRFYKSDIVGSIYHPYGYAAVHANG